MKRVMDNRQNFWMDVEHIESNENLVNNFEEAPLVDEDEVYEEDNEVYCLCKQPWGGKFMICCDFCENWYHAICMGLKEDVAKNLKVYTCKFCLIWLEANRFCDDLLVFLFSVLFRLLNLKIHWDLSIPAFLELRTVSKKFESVIMPHVLKSATVICPWLLRRIGDFSYYSGLERIDFGSCYAYRTKLPQFNSIVALKNLRIFKCPDCMDDTHLLSKLTQLTYLNLPTKYDYIDTLTTLTNLTVLNLPCTEIKSLSEIPNTTKLVKLNVEASGPLFSISILPLKDQFNNLKKLNLRLDLTNSEIGALAQCTQLTSLGLHNIRVNDVPYVVIDDALVGLTNLVSLNLSRIKLRGEVINTLLKLTRLTCKSIFTHYHSISNLTRLIRLHLDSQFYFFRTERT